MLSALFEQYKNKTKVYFGSKWLDKHGRMFIGNPKKMGLENVTPEALERYYYLSNDRWAPLEEGHQLKWRQDNLLMNTLREVERPQISKGVSAACAVVIVCLFTLSGVFGGVAALKDWSKSKFKELTSSEEAVQVEQASDEAFTHDECIDLLIWLDEEGKKSKNYTAEERKVVDQCMKDFPRLQGDVATRQLELINEKLGIEGGY